MNHNHELFSIIELDYSMISSDFRFLKLSEASKLYVFNQPNGKTVGPRGHEVGKGCPIPPTRNHTIFDSDEKKIGRWGNFFFMTLENWVSKYTLFESDEKKIGRWRNFFFMTLENWVSKYTLFGDNWEWWKKNWSEEEFFFHDSRKLSLKVTFF